MLNHLFAILSLLTWLFTMIMQPVPPVIRYLEPPVYTAPPREVEVVASTHVSQFSEDIHCLALNAYFEARNSSWEDMIATAHVVINRAKSPRYPSSICDVVWQPYQFSWTHDNRPDSPNVLNKIEAQAWRKANAVAVQTYLGLTEDITGGATHYHAYYVEPFWTSDNRVKIGKHFYMRVS